MTSSARSIDPIKYAEQICYSSKETLMFSYEMAKKYADKPGVYVECGVAAGAQIIAMAHGAPNKTIYAFDSFQGIPFPSNRDDQMPGIRKLTSDEIKKLPNPGQQVLESTGATSVSENDFWEHLHNSGIEYFGRLHTVKGWFEDTVPTVVHINDIAILRLDGDLYNSTAVCLKHLYPKVIQGGIVIIDDYELRGCRLAVDEFLTDHPEVESINVTPDGIAYFYK